jgi:hypothetical protein
MYVCMYKHLQFLVRHGYIVSPICPGGYCSLVWIASPAGLTRDVCERFCHSSCRGHHGMLAALLFSSPLHAHMLVHWHGFQPAGVGVHLLSQANVLTWPPFMEHLVARNAYAMARRGVVCSEHLHLLTSGN